ncbi:MAG: hypothetical protein JO346_03850 [Alphaproteobacteria bacterium]|nr:hypothetical protein [Alphaproteobacteria bacterium]
MMRRLFALALLLPTSANAGAWALGAGHWQSFSSATTSQAAQSFDASGRPTIPTAYHKMLFQNLFEVGVTNYLTLFATPAYVIADVTTPTVRYIRANNTSIEAGARIALLAFHGHLSIQGSYKAAGSFDFQVSAHRDSGKQEELRLLYGTGFKLYDRDGFFDLQIAQRGIDHPRPNETPIDLTGGLWINSKTMVMAQSFNIISAGDALPPYTFYRTHKLALSVVQKLSRHWSLQVGAFYSPAGQNALVERGVSVSLWTQD